MHCIYILAVSYSFEFLLRRFRAQAELAASKLSMEDTDEEDTDSAIESTTGKISRHNSVGDVKRITPENSVQRSDVSILLFYINLFNLNFFYFSLAALAVSQEETPGLRAPRDQAAERGRDKTQPLISSQSLVQLQTLDQRLVTWRIRIQTLGLSLSCILLIFLSTLNILGNPELLEEK